MDFNLLVIIVLCILAIIDLTVGVANDAVNFLNAAIGSRAAKFKTVLWVAALGVFVGVTFSSGMLSVAKNGIFDPSFFTLSEVLIIFVAVMFADIILLDTFNTFGLPTSTTVSVIAGLFGSAIAVTMVKVSGLGQEYSTIFNYINSGKVITIFTAILLSVVMAFVFGSLIQWITRLLFTFNYHLKFKKYGAIWAGLSLTALSFFVLFKGLKGASFLTKEHLVYIDSHIALLVGATVVFWTLLTGILLNFTKVNVLRMIVLIGTFALALAFAANDLVNFIGAPLAGLTAYTHTAHLPDAATATMNILNEDMPANTYLLLLAGLVMVLTLFLSKKAQSVTKITINLTRQEEGYERFESNLLARNVVRLVISMFAFLKTIFPESLRHKISARFDTSEYKPELDENGQAPAFDLLRAAVILFVSAALISIGTFFKLPLSTTYITFIVAMAAALPDKSWGRDSAVYRVSGVITVVGGWFITAFSAALIAFVIALIIAWGHTIAVIGFSVLTGLVMYKSAKYHKSKEEEHEKSEEAQISKMIEQKNVLAEPFEKLKNSTHLLSETFAISLKSLNQEDLYNLKLMHKQAKRLQKDYNSIVSDLLRIQKNSSFDDDMHDTMNLAITISSIQEISERLVHSTHSNLGYVDNNHIKFTQEQIEEIEQIADMLEKLLFEIAETFASKNFSKLDELKAKENNLHIFLKKATKNQLKRVKKATSNIRRSRLYLRLLADMEIISISTIKLTCAMKEMLHDNK